MKTTCVDVDGVDHHNHNENDKENDNESVGDISIYNLSDKHFIHYKTFTKSYSWEENHVPENFSSWKIKLPKISSKTSQKEAFRPIANIF